MFSRNILRPLLSPTTLQIRLGGHTSLRQSLPRNHATTTSPSSSAQLSSPFRSSPFPRPRRPQPPKPSIFHHKQQQCRSLRLQFPLPPSSSRYSYNRFQSRRTTIFHLWKTSQPFRCGVYIVIIGAGGIYITNIETVPVSGRRRFNVISPHWESRIAQSMYTSTLEEFGSRILPEGHHMTRMVRRVMGRLIRVSGMEDLNWEVFVINDDRMKNAFVIPGGKVFVFSGILPICRNDHGLAAVLSHEISHTVAHHTAERASKNLLALIPLVFVFLLGIDFGIGRLFMDLIFLHPSSRNQEAEADYIGLMMMSSACFNPEEAIGVWERMEKVDVGAPPQFLSTHPAHRTRIKNLGEWMPEALDKQAQSDCHQTMDYAEQFRKAFDSPIW